jgi:hypothetical protein
MVADANEFWGLTAHGWTAAGTVALALATAFLATIALYQIRELRLENRKTQTLVACGNYDQNQVIFSCAQQIWQARDDGELQENPEKYCMEMITLLNFLDAIAIGIEQDLYIEDLARKHLKSIVQRQTEQLIDSGILEKAGIRKDAFQSLLRLRDRWLRH